MHLLDYVLVLVAVAYAGAAAAIVLIKCVPAFNNLLLYGKNVSIKKPSASQGPLQRVIDWVFGLTVPKAYFTHFYVLLTVWCAAISWVVPRWAPATDASDYSSAYKSFRIIHGLLWVQALRRLVECVYLTRFSPSSPINILHYLVGMMHYTLVSIACLAGLWLHRTSRHQPLDGIDYVLVVLFLVVSIQQSCHHHHLASLKKYSLPAFRSVACPHYLDEIQLYAVLFVLSARAGARTVWIPLCFLASLVFVSVNLSVSSLDSHKFYQQKFREYKLKYSIIPGVL